MTNYNLDEGRGVLATLRHLFPERSLRFSEALRVAELQATALRRLTRVEDARLPHEVITELPRIRVESRAIPTSGLSYWDGDNWVIGLNDREPMVRQRFTLLHEYKHIVDHGRAERLYRGTARQSAEQQAEQVADFFAGCALVPRTELKRAWANGLQRLPELARHFDVSERAIGVRLAQVGLIDETERCDSAAPSVWPRARGRYYRSLSSSWFALQPREIAA